MLLTWRGRICNLQTTSDAHPIKPPIMKTYLYDFDPLKPYFYVVNEAVLMSTYNRYFEHKYEKY